MQMKQQEELQRYLQQIQQNIETVSVSELLQAIMSQQTYLSQQSVASGVSTGTAWSSVVQLVPPPTGVIYSTAGIHQSPLPTTFVPQTLGDVNTSHATMLPEAVVENLHGQPCTGSSLPGTASLGPSVTDGLTGGDSRLAPAAAVADALSVNIDITAIPDSLDLATRTADRSCSPGISLRRTNSLKEQLRPASSDGEVTSSDKSLHAPLRRKQSADAAAFLTGDVLVLEAVPSTSNPVDEVPPQLPEVSSLGFVPIQNQPISSRSDSLDSMASSVAGSAVQQSVENSDLVQQYHPVSIRDTSVAESGSSNAVSSQPTVCNTSTQPVATTGNQHPAELLDTIQDTVQSLLGQLAAGNCDGIAAGRPRHSLPSATVEPAQQLQQSQAIIQQQQHQQVAAIASAIQNLQHLRSLQEAIGSLAVALKTSQLQMLTAAVQAGDVCASAGASVAPSASSVTSVVAGTVTTLPAAVRSPTLPVSSCPPQVVHISATAAVPPAAPAFGTVPGLLPEPHTFPQSQLTAAQLAALGPPPPYPNAGNAVLMPSSAMQQQQQQLLLAMMQSAPYQQQHQQLLMQQLQSQNAAMMQQGAVRAAGRGQQQLWPVMMLPPHCVASAVRRPIPHSGLPAMMSAQQVPQRLGVPAVVNPASLPLTTTLPTPACTAVPLMSGNQTPVPVRPAVTNSSSSNATVPSLQTNLPDQR